MDSKFPMHQDLLDLSDLFKRTEAFLIRVEKVVHRCTFRYKIKGILTPPDRIRLKKDAILIEGPTEGPMAPVVGLWILLGLLKRAGQGVRRGAEYRWPYMRSVVEGGWRMMKEGFMRILVSEAVKV